MKTCVINQGLSCMYRPSVPLEVGPSTSPHQNLLGVCIRNVHSWAPPLPPLRLNLVPGIYRFHKSPKWFLLRTTVECVTGHKRETSDVEPSRLLLSLERERTEDRKISMSERVRRREQLTVLWTALVRQEGGGSQPGRMRVCVINACNFFL